MPEINHPYSHSLLKRLGFQPDQRVAIFHADDVGMCHGANLAFEELSKDGMITCGSVMVPCPWFLEAAAYCHQHPEADVGVHLTDLGPPSPPQPPRQGVGVAVPPPSPASG